MKRWLLGATLLGVLSLLLVACGGEATGEADGNAAAPTTLEPAAEPEAAVESNSSETVPANKRQKKKANAKKKRQVAVALGDPAEFDLVPAKPQVKAGMVTIKLKNTGSIEHELIVIPTDLGSAELPTDENGAAVEHGAVVPHGSGQGKKHTGAHVGTHVPAGAANVVKLKLEPGTYALVCNLPGHYAAGMHSNLTVVA
jgi:uncharacterized cupredoxin-like copper-binding protein